MFNRNAAAGRHRAAVVGIRDASSLLQPRLERHRTERDAHAVGRRQMQAVHVVDDRVAERAELVARVGELAAPTSAAPRPCRSSSPALRARVAAVAIIARVRLHARRRCRCASAAWIFRYGSTIDAGIDVRRLRESCRRAGRAAREPTTHDEHHNERKRLRPQCDCAHRTTVSGIVGGAVKLAIDTCAAMRSAAAMNARAAGESGSLMTSGTPVSPPSRIG